MSAQLLRELLSKCTKVSGVIPRVNGAIEPLAAYYQKATGSLLEQLLTTTWQGELGGRNPSALDHRARLPLWENGFVASWLGLLI